MPCTMQLDTCGRRRSPATLSSFHQGRPPRNKGRRYPADPPTVEEIIAVMHSAGDDHDAVRLRGVIIVLWRAGLRISEALALNESDLDLHRGAILVRHGNGGKRREVGMDRWAWEQLTPWVQRRAALPVGALFCVLGGPTAGRPWAPADDPSHSRPLSLRPLLVDRPRTTRQARGWLALRLSLTPASRIGMSPTRSRDAIRRKKESSRPHGGGVTVRLADCASRWTSRAATGRHWG
jgi:integrase